MENGAFVLEVRVHGRTVREYHHQNEVWIEGRKGSDFSLRAINHSAGRVLVLPTVDGLSVMDGKEASYDSGGYVLQPFGHIEIPGWRLDDDKVASFRFHKSGRSYAAQMDKPRNIGVIGCAFFGEKQPKPTRICDKGPPSRGFVSTQSMGFSPEVSVYFCSCGNSQLDSMHATNSVAPSLGTEFGSEMVHKTYTTTFVKNNDRPDVEMAIRYGDKDELRQRGVDLDQRPVVAHTPSPFPKEEHGCKPPPGWSGR